MTPTSSNLNKSTCAPISSNCVLWDGGSITGIEICSGDSIGDVATKINTYAQALGTQLTLTDIDLSCLVTACSGCPAPSKTLSSILTLLITKVCTLADLIVTPGTTYVEPTLTLATCIQYVNDAGATVTSLPMHEYVTKIGLKVCDILSSLNAEIVVINNHESRIDALEAATPSTYTPPTVTPSCVLASTPTQMNLVLTALETQFCQLKGATGSATDLLAAAAKQCIALSSSPALSQTGNMSGIPGWKSTAITAADTINNMWLTICDMRAAIINLQSCCGAVNCAEFILGFTVAGNDTRDVLNVMFNGHTTIPTGMTNCSLAGSKVTVKDSAGHTYVANFDLILKSTDIEGLTVNLLGSTINTALPYTITVEGCVTKDGVVCSKTVVETLSVPCPIVTGVTATLV